jgi:murein DD-endopeptidase MepM/ murein hydrolase activator NlpD
MESTLIKQSANIILFLLLAVMAISACGRDVSSEASVLSPPNLPSLTQTPLNIPAPSTTPGPAATWTTQPTSTPPNMPEAIISSPLDGIDIKDLPAFITNKFSPPPFGSDNPHQGVDFSIVDPDTNLAVPGNPVRAVFSGTVASIIQDRFPYGNAILLETCLDTISPLISKHILIPTPAPLLRNHPVLTCPDVGGWIDSSRLENTVDITRSLYILYAHLENPVSFQQGDEIIISQIVGRIGSSGNALNPHLHLESRIGPAGLRIPSMAHYDTSATQEEMTYYCLWRISGLFQLIDPMVFFNPSP